MAKPISLIEKKYGRLVVIKRMDNNKHRQSVWLCECDCGEEKIILGQHLRSSHTKSCGCLLREGIRTTHGHAKTKTYHSWYNMIQRCTDPNHKYYHCYGGRGITVCKRWLKIENFFADMGEAPEGHQIDRIDNNKGYCKSNCRWATRKEQTRNTRRNHLETYESKTQCISAWAEEYNINYGTLWHRIYKYGWSMEKALITPVQKRRRQKK